MTVSADLSKLSNAVNNDAVKNTVHDTIAAKVNAINKPSTSGLVPKTQYNSNKQSLEKKIKHVDKEIYNTS